MNTALLAVGAIALAGASFGAGRVTCHASATASAPPVTTTTGAIAAPAAAPATASASCESKDEVAEMIRNRKAEHEEAVRRANKRAAKSGGVSYINPVPAPPPGQ
jgi:hypothetical protein